MSLIVEKKSENILAIRTNNQVPSDKEEDCWIYRFLTIANKIFDNSTMIVVTKRHLKYVLYDDAKEFRDLLEDKTKIECLEKTHHFMTHEFTHKGIKYITTKVLY